MRIETVTRVDLKGQYEVLYAGADRMIAKKCYKDNMLKKDEFLYLFHQTSFRAGGSRTVSKGGFAKDLSELKPYLGAKKRKKKESPSEDSAE